MATRSSAASPSLSRIHPFGDIPSLSSHELTDTGTNALRTWKPTAVSWRTPSGR
jgi:hypothetical protein